MDLANITKAKILEMLNEGKRMDGRGLLDFRDLEIETEASSKAEGSSKVKLGDTEVIVGVKMDLMEPYPDSPDEGVMMVTAELSPLASDKFESGPPGINSITLARIVDRSIRESGLIDTKQLCVEKGEKVWAVMIDISPINDGGNLIDASSIAAVVALLNTKMPKLEEDKVKYGELTDKPLPLNKIPINLTAYKIGDHFIFDPISEEQEASEMKLAVSLVFEKDKAIINGALKEGDGSLTITEVVETVEKMIKQGKKLHDKISKFK